MSTHSGSHLSTLCANVQFNCAISDARYARDYSLCIYLLRMREFYRWHFDIPFKQRLETDVVGSWISDMEAHWDDIEEAEFKPLIIDDITFDPFESDAINAQLYAHGLAYSAGYGRLGQPHFLLAELVEKSTDASSISYECGKELARDSITLPAMTQGHTIFIRHDSIKRHLWQMLDEWYLQKNDGPLARIVRHYSLDNLSDNPRDKPRDKPGDNPKDSPIDNPKNNTELDPNHDPCLFSTQLEQAATELRPLYREHELGEVAAGELLGDRFHQLLQRVVGTRNEFYLRAVRDILADSLRTWPYILASRSEIALDFWLASLTGVRLEFLKLTSISKLFSDQSPDGARLDQLSADIDAEQQRWISIAEHLMTHSDIDSDTLDIRDMTLELLQHTGKH